MNDLTPAQHTGKAIDASSTREFGTVTDAKIFFTVARERLRKVNDWHKIAGKLLATFKLVDRDGREAERAPIEGDYLKIDIPGPGSMQGSGYDWVRVEAIEYHEFDDAEEYAFRVRPAPNPIEGTGETAHFYSPEATSTFVIRRSQERVSAEVHDRNTTTNNEADSPADMLRHKVVGAAGLMAFSKIQWQSLTDGLIAGEE
jgi:hypothetical protein